MQASIRASSGRFWVVTPAGTVTATAGPVDASVFELSGDGSVPILVRDVKSGRFLAVAPDGTVTVRHVAPDLLASALTSEPTTLSVDTPRAFRAPDRVHWLTVDAAQGSAVRADATARGVAETFTLTTPVISVSAPELVGAAGLGSAVAGGDTLLAVPGWRQCARCGVLYDETVPSAQRGCFDVVGAASAQMLRGPRPRRTHTPKGDVVYRVLTTKTRTHAAVFFLRCNLCAALIDRTDLDRPCGAAGGGIHRYAGSAGYSATLAVADAPLRPTSRWRICAGCSALYHDDGSATCCPVDAGHTPRDGLGYMLDKV